MKTLRLLFLLLLLGLRASAQTNEVDLTAAFTQLKGNGPVPFANALYGIDLDSARQLANQLTPLLRQAGEYTGHEILSRNPLTKRIERLTIVIYFEHFPVFMRLDYYDTPRGKICLPAFVTRDASAVG